MPVYKDQLQNTVTLSDIPKRIISLVPSQTELLYDLGLEDETIGITKFCVHPDKWFRSKTRIGGTKTLNIPLIQSLQPDLIIANKEENIQQQVAALYDIAPLWISDINNTDDALDMITSIGLITGKKIEAQKIIAQLKKDLQELNILASLPGNKKYRTAYLIWKDPYMAAAGGTFINDILQKCGWENTLQQKTRYPEINIEELRSIGTELLLLSSEPYPFRQKHIDELQEQLPTTKILLVDGEMFSWYGSRMLKMLPYLKALMKSLPLIPTP